MCEFKSILKFKGKSIQSKGHSTSCGVKKSVSQKQSDGIGDGKSKMSVNFRKFIVLSFDVIRWSQ